MLRAFCSDWEGGETVPELGRDEVHHLARVRRVRAGEPVEILNGRGAIGTCRVNTVDQKRLDLTLISSRQAPVPPIQPHLLVAVPKGKTFPAVLQKAVELGASRITPIQSTHSEVTADRVDRKSDRWESVLIEAVKQSGNPWMPRLDAPVPILEALAESPDGGLRLCAALQEDAVPLWQVLQREVDRTGEVQIYVGPEGDFSQAEYAALRQSGCQFVSLGPIVLRVETAASLMLGAFTLLNSH